MGASESTTARTNGTGNNEENRQQEAGGSSIGEAVAIAAAGVATAGVAVWGISKMLSENINDRQQKEGHHGMESLLINSRQIIDHVSNAPLAFNSQGKLSASLAPRGEGEASKRSVWSPPPTGRFKINTDGGCHSILGRPYEYPQDLPDDSVVRRTSGYGGILRDHRGNFVRGFRGFIGVTDCFTAELHGIHKGLELLDKHGYRGAILESDCEPVVNWINRKDHNNTSKSKIISDSWDIILECRRLAHKNNTAINHVKGDDANQCAHKLADLAIDKEDIHVEIEDVSQLPGDIKRLVDKDAKTTGYPSNVYAY